MPNNLPKLCVLYAQKIIPGENMDLWTPMMRIFPMLCLFQKMNPLARPFSAHQTRTRLVALDELYLIFNTARDALHLKYLALKSQVVEKLYLLHDILEDLLEWSRNGVHPAYIDTEYCGKDIQHRIIVMVLVPGLRPRWSSIVLRVASCS
ncbi:hypothetical protein BDY19DRAFT_312896 [Irpex rosettiformis]|uniref:Uncharacterized protein n=1 Tax=Irpex rosettiformis TaxID=378272 RepID=A0ACB8TZD0_9APHY|nr:hypothetical protein BDY19DRAFT_312896 [Irpex rosettiformis]